VISAPLGTTVAMNVRSYRALRDVNGSQLAERMRERGFSWSQATVSRIEHGTRYLTVDELDALADILVVPVTDFLVER